VPTVRDPAAMLATLVVQHERERRVFRTGGIVYVAGNLALAAVAWGLGGARLGWIPPAIAFLANVYYVLTVEWETRWETIWRREAPRIERALGAEVLSPVLAEAGPRRVVRWLKWTSWALSAAWLAALLVAIAAAGLDFRLGG
jgi:hypothetical protein